MHAHPGVQCCTVSVREHTHTSYDEGATRCVTDTETREWARQHHVCTDKPCRAARRKWAWKWVRDRLATELLLHVLHAVGVVSMVVSWRDDVVPSVWRASGWGLSAPKGM